MAKLIYLMLMSLDGYIADKNGDFDWAQPTDEVHSFANDLERPVGTHLYGRNMYEVMAIWDTLQTHGQPHYIGDFASIWRAADKIVYSTTLKSVSTERTQLARGFEADTIQRMKDTASRDITIGGPNLAAHAFKAGLIDLCHIFVFPTTVGDGKSAFPRGLRLELELQSERRFGGGIIYLQYRSARSQAA